MLQPKPPPQPFVVETWYGLRPGSSTLLVSAGTSAVLPTNTGTGLSAVFLTVTLPETVVEPVTANGVFRTFTPRPPGGPTAPPCCANDTVAQQAVTTAGTKQRLTDTTNLFISPS